MSKPIALIQARTASTRLPNKILADISGKPLLQRVIERLKRCPEVAEVVVATSSMVDSDIKAICCACGVAWHGVSDEANVLKRFFYAAELWKAKAVLRITADCPFFDPELAGQLITLATAGGADYAYIECDVPQLGASGSNKFPEGLDCEFISWLALSAAQLWVTDPADREHVTPWISRNHERFQKASITAERDYSGLKWSVDTAADLEFARAVYAEMGRDDFGWKDVVDLVTREPKLLEINGQTWRPDGG